MEKNEALQLVQKRLGGRGGGVPFSEKAGRNQGKDSQFVQKEAGSQPERVLHNCLY